jgi:hypothetical protein
MSSKKDGQHKLALFMSSKKDGQHKLALFGSQIWMEIKDPSRVRERVLIKPRS